MSLAFMCQKSFHPQSKANQRRKWMAEEEQKELQKRQAERRKQREEEIIQGIGSSTKEGKSSSVSFLYNVPKMAKEEEKEAVEEKTFEEQKKEAFAMKNAPKAGSYVDGVDYKAKPFGLEVRRVKCARCGDWGHQSGDIVCKMKDENPNDEFHRLLEDPLTAMKMQSQTDGNKLRLKSTLRAGRQHGIGQKSDTSELFEIIPEGPRIDPTEEFLNSLGKKDRRRLLKILRQQQDGTDSGAASDSSYSSSSEEEAEKRRRRKKRKSKHKKRDHKRSKRRRDDSDDDGDVSKVRRRRSPTRDNSSRPSHSKRRRSRSASASPDRRPRSKRRTSRSVSASPDQRHRRCEEDRKQLRHARSRSPTVNDGYHRSRDRESRHDREHDRDRHHHNHDRDRRRR